MLPNNAKELMNGVVVIQLTSLNEVLRVEINAAAAWAVQAGVQGSQFAAFRMAKVHYDVIERLSNQIWTDMKRVLEEIQISPYQELGQDLKGYFKEKINAPYSICRAGVYARLQGIAAQPSFENHYENLERKIFAEVDLFCAKLDAQESEKKANRMSANVTSIVCGDNSRVLVNSQDNSINVANLKLLFAEIQKAVDSQIQDEKLKGDLRKKVSDMEENVGKGGFIKSYSDFVALAANHMTIIGPFLPALTQLLQAGGAS
jgi:hypothetical protein